MSDGSNDDTSAIASAIAAGVIIFFFGACLIEASLGLIVSVFSEDLGSEIFGGRSPNNPDWTAWWGYWCTWAASTSIALWLAIVAAKRTYRDAVRKAAETSSGVRRPRVVQFSLRSLLFLQLYVALGLGLIGWLGRPVAPCVCGVFAAIAGYGATLVSGRRRLFDVVVAYLLGILVAGIVLSTPSRPFISLEQEATNERLRDWIVITTPAVFPVVALVAKRRLKKWEQSQ